MKTVRAMTMAVVGATWLITLPTQAAVSAETKQEVTALSAFAVGAVAGGPLGAIAGILASTFLLDDIEKAQQYAVSQQALEQEKTTVAQLRQALDQAEQHVAMLQEQRDQQLALALKPLALELLFKTGGSELSTSGQQRLALLGEYLQSHSDLQVTLEGFADPRGAAEYNWGLSEQRALAVANHLFRLGVEPGRVTIQAYGEGASAAAEGDIDAYALERKVRIVVRQSTDGKAVAQTQIP